MIPQHGIICRFQGGRQEVLEGIEHIHARDFTELNMVNAEQPGLAELLRDARKTCASAVLCKLA